MNSEPVLIIDKPDFIVRLYEDVVEVDLKEGAKKKLGSPIPDSRPLRRRFE